ncbi:MAG: Asp-tRNA(Asn)/Glu-tRNA(Gln) amidotransferase subunit GatB [Myxococcota bacterium]|nr:Asp-tRNA(Asn)/Glu-tRNA(Gln) amidotransferase subunit GatB [Myxococcota bacterium]
MFCGCSTAWGAPPNTQVCPVCLGLPGALPVPNRQAIELAIRAALSTGCEVRELSRFARKNYFYPDLAKGYQISQFELPLNEHGTLEIETAAGGKKKIGITRIHLEEDAAKNLHGVGAGTDTLVDFNRAGVALIEIVGGPDLRSADEAVAYLDALRDILMFAGVNDGNLEEGSFRCDANVSIRPVGQEAFGTRAELKNINSFRFVKKAIEHEIARQEALLSSGGKVVQETRTWSEAQGKTLSLRSKEEAHDYRYFSDPDLPPLSVDPKWIAEVRATLPIAPAARRASWRSELGLTEYDARVLSGHPAIARFFERAVEQTASATKQSESAVGKKVANFVQGEVLRVSSTSGLEMRAPVSPERVAELLALIEDGTINGKIAKDVLAEMVETGKAPRAIVDARGLAQVTDAGAIEAAVRKVVGDHPGEVEKYRAGKVSLRGFLVGQIMKATRGTANPAIVNQLLDQVLAEA